MIFSVPREILTKEGRVGLTPAAVQAILTDPDSQVKQIKVEKDAGVLSGFTDEDYKNAGAVVVDTPAEAWTADLVIKIKQPLSEEFKYFKTIKAIHTFLHTADHPRMAQAMMAAGVTGISYDTVEADGVLVILKPMSVIAGELAVDMGRRYRSIVQHATVIGCGISGVAALNKLRLAPELRGILKSVNVFELSEKLPGLKKRFIPNFGVELEFMESNTGNITRVLPTTDLLINAVLVEGNKAPKLISRAMAEIMPANAVIVDISIDQGGLCEFSRPTTHDHPTFMVGQNNVIYYGVANMPGMVPKRATRDINEASLPFNLEIARYGLGPIGIMRWSKALQKGINIYQGAITHQGVAEGLRENGMKVEYAKLGDKLF